jgi:bifunctional non-homologous end joining protein LigD
VALGLIVAAGSLPLSMSTTRTPVRTIGISHPDRVLYETPRLTKLDVARYYDRVADDMLPHVKGRPLTLVRCGEGIAHGCFYMKHSKVWASPELTRVKIREKTKIGDYLVVESDRALIALVQMGILEIHTWNVCYPEVECPDRMVLDLDPGPEVAWKTVVSAARTVRRLLHTLDLGSFVKTTGGKGLHVVFPLAPKPDWATVKSFAQALAEDMAKDRPDRYVANMAKKQRHGRIYVDYLRNGMGATAVAAYSTRARAGAAVSTPLAWEELGPSIRADHFTIENLPNRLAYLDKDPWAEMSRLKQRLP